MGNLLEFFCFLGGLARLIGLYSGHYLRGKICVKCAEGEQAKMLTIAVTFVVRQQRQHICIQDIQTAWMKAEL